MLKKKYLDSMFLYSNIYQIIVSLRNEEETSFSQQGGIITKILFLLLSTAGKKQ
jgi:hypothetical protein